MSSKKLFFFLVLLCATIGSQVVLLLVLMSYDHFGGYADHQFSLINIIGSLFGIFIGGNIGLGLWFLTIRFRYGGIQLLLLLLPMALSSFVIRAHISEQIAPSLIRAAFLNDISYFERSAMKQENVNIKDVNGQTALIKAVMNGNIEFAKHLIRMGADLNLQNAQNSTALISASNQGDYEFVEQLIRLGADLNPQDNRGWTALMVASYGGRFPGIGHCKSMEQLIKAGADISIKGNNNRDALDISYEVNNSCGIKLLTRFDSNVKNESKDLYQP